MMISEQPELKVKMLENVHRRRRGGVGGDGKDEGC